MSRKLFGVGNPVELKYPQGVLATTPVTSDKLFVEKFAHKALIHSLMLDVYIEGQGGNGGAPTIASLGNFALYSTGEGKIFEFPLRMWVTGAPYLGVPIYQLGGGVQDLYINWNIPIPFALIQGVRPKDSYLVSEKCNDYYFQLNGTPEQGVTYLQYTGTPKSIGEKNNYAALPCKAPLQFTQDTIPATNNWYSSKLNIVGPSWVMFCKDDYSDFDEHDAVSLWIDGMEMQNYPLALTANRAYAYTQQLRSHAIAADTIPDNVIIFPLMLDSKAAKITRSSLFEFRWKNSGQAAYNLMAMYQPIIPLTANEVFNLAKRQSPALVSESDINAVRKVPVDGSGTLNPIQAKDLYAKLYRYDPKANETIRLANTA